MFRRYWQRTADGILPAVMEASGGHILHLGGSGFASASSAAEVVPGPIIGPPGTKVKRGTLSGPESPVSSRGRRGAALMHRPSLSALLPRAVFASRLTYCFRREWRRPVFNQES